MKRYSIIPIAFACALGPAVGATQNSPVSIHRNLLYTITMDGKSVGTNDAIVVPERDGRVTLFSRIRIDVQSLLFPYHYTSSARETWSGDRLISAEAKTVEDGETSRIKVTRAADTVVVITNKGERRFLGNVATTSFWNLPRLPDTTLTFLDVETGADFRARAQFVREAEIILGDATVSCRLWQLLGDAKTQLWFDRDDVLIRMEYEEQGKRFVHILNRPTTTLQEKQ